MNMKRRITAQKGEEEVVEAVERNIKTKTYRKTAAAAAERWIY